MKYRTTALTLLVCVAGHTSSAQAQDQWAISPAMNHSNDSDGLTVQKVFATAMPKYASGLKWQGMEWQDQRYSQNGNRLNGHGLNYTAQDIDAVSGMGYTLKAGVNQGPQHTTAIGDWSWNQAINGQVNAGLFASRDWVESIGALQQGIRYDLVGGNVDYQVHPRMTLIGSLAQTHFSDGQHRQQQRARVVWDAWPDQGLTLQWAYKHQLGERDVVNRTYFNPERLNESMAIVGWRRRYQGWQWYARMGEGRQKVSDQDSTPARIAELQVTSPITGQSFFKLRGGRNETIGLNGPGYVYRYFDVQWIWPLGR